MAKADAALFFRDQDISIDAHKAFGRRFGDLHIHPAANDYNDGVKDHPEILVIHADEKTTRTAGDSWHSDVSCDAEPPMMSILRLHTLPPLGGDTLFASMYAAYDALSEPMKQLVGGLTATHDGGPNYRDRAGRQGVDTAAKAYPASSHPIVRTHPETGRKALLLPIPFEVAKVMGALLQFLPAPPLTLDHVRLLQEDNVVDEGKPGFADLGITDLETVEAIVPAYLARFRKPGREPVATGDRVMD